MDTGQLRHRVHLQYEVESFPHGQKSVEWVSVGSFWALVTFESAAESAVNTATEAISQAKVELRYQEITSKHRFFFRNKVLNVVGQPIADATKTFVVCSCTCREADRPRFECVGAGGIHVGGSSDAE